MAETSYQVVDKRGQSYIQEKINIPALALPATPGQAIADINLPALIGTLMTQSTREYAASPDAAWLGAYLRSLPPFIDDVTRDFGDDLYARMLFDAQVAGDFRTIKSLALEGGMHVDPFEDLKDGSGPTFGVRSSARPRQASAMSREICDFVRRCLDNLDQIQSVDDVNYELLNGAAYGNKPGELVWDIPTRGKMADKLVLKAVKPKARHSTAYVVDAWNNIIGVLVLVPGQIYPGMANWVLADPAQVPNLLVRRKFCVFSFAPENGDPRGTSLLRAAYYAWNNKLQIIFELLRYLTQFAGSSLWANTPPNATTQVLVDGNGAPIMNPLTGQPITLNPETNLMSGLLGMRNGSVMVVPDGVKINSLNVNSEGDPFFKALEYADRQISKALTGQMLATNEGLHQARASSDTHENTLMLIPGILRRSLVHMWMRDIIRPLVEMNYGEDAVDIAPEVSIGDTSTSDFKERGETLAQLGYTLDESQFSEIDLDLGVPKRADDWLTRRDEQAKANGGTYRVLRGDDSSTEPTGVKDSLSAGKRAA